MEYKKCEHCGEQIHIRSKKCPFCNEIVEETPQNIEENISTEEEISETSNVSEQINEKSSNDEPEKTDAHKEEFNFVVGKDEPKDYVYKAEVRHSIEYVEPMSNWAKVFISALCTIPLIGQIIGTFLGVFFITYEDLDRKSFGKAIILLSIVMFLIYSVYISNVISLMGDMDIESLYKTLLEQ